MKVKRVETIYFSEEENKFLADLADFCSARECNTCPCKQFCDTCLAGDTSLLNFCTALSDLSKETED